jgi:hypothetical protein
MSEEDHEIIQCCFNKDKDSLERVYELLQSERGDPFYLDDSGLSGLDYLLMPDAEGRGSGYFLVSYRVYTDLLVKYIKLYYENNPNDQVLNRNLQKYAPTVSFLKHWSNICGEMSAFFYTFIAKKQSQPTEQKL